MSYAFLANESAPEALHRIIREQFDRAITGLDNWDGSVKKLGAVGRHVEQILIVCNLARLQVIPEYSDQIKEFRKIHKKITGIDQSATHLNAFKYLKKVHPDWFKINPTSMAERILRDESGTISLDKEYINKIVQNSKIILDDARDKISTWKLENIRMQDLVDNFYSERSELTDKYYKMRTKRTDQSIKAFKKAIKTHRQQTRLFRKLNHRYTKLHMRSLKALYKHLKTYTRLTSLRENFLEHPEHYGTYAQILLLLGLIDRTKKEILSLIKPLGKIRFSILNDGVTARSQKILGE